MRCLSFAAICILLGASRLFAEDTKPSPRENVGTAVAEGVRLLETKAYEEFLKTFVAPEDLKKLSDKMTVKEYSEKFAEKKAPMLLQVLKSIQDSKPVMSDDGREATFELKKELGAQKDSIVFLKIDKYWYIEK
jgi:hypothetical protein